jgi:pyrroloquinoline quinone biosynthesis protein B
MIVRVLGSAAGGGVPQWNCACARCTAAREGRAPRRTQSSIAVSADGERWLLVNCSPDIAQQIEEFAPLQPRGTRGTPIAGMLFTDANVDHLGGLAVLRQAGDHKFLIRSSRVVREIAARQAAFAPFTVAPHQWLSVPIDGALEVVADLRVRTFAVPGLTPGYDGRRDVAGAVVAYEFEAGTKRVLFAPVFSGIDGTLLEAIERSDLCFLDGSFYYDDELERYDLGDKRARALGHLHLSGEDGTLARIAGVKSRVIFTHINNSNPILDPASPEFAAVQSAGAEVAYDGLVSS